MSVWQDKIRRNASVPPSNHRSRSLERLEDRNLLVADVIISEFMASNATTLFDADGDSADWIELQNSTPNPIDLTGWGISDDALDSGKWTFPAVELEPGGFLILFASGKNRRDVNELHTNFKLSKDGEYLGISRPDGTIEDEYRDEYPAQETDISYGRNNKNGQRISGYMTTPTPGEQNEQAHVGFVGDVSIDVPGGIFDSAFQVEIASETPDVEIRYTTDGSKPTETNGRLYVAPILVDSTTTLRAAAFKMDFVPSTTETSTYLYLDEVAKQVKPESYPELASSDNYEVDPDIAQSDQYRDRFLAGLRAIPTLSLVMEKDDFVGDAGIYAHPLQRGDRWERPVSVELIDPVSQSTSQIDAGIRVQGGASRNPEIGKHSLSLRFRDEYGTGRWKQTLFEKTPVDEFSTLALRAGSNNSWVSGNAVDRRHAQSIRDQWIRDSLWDMGHADAGKGDFVHVYINGLYWGIYNLTERPDADHYAAYFGGDANDYDAFNGREAIDGTDAARTAVNEIAASGDWERIQQVVDIDRYIDYTIINRYGANGDLDASRNYRLAGGGANMAPFRLYPWDSEEVLINSGSTGIPTDPLGIRIHVEKLEEYRIRFADRLQKHFFHDGAMTAEQAAARWRRRSDQLDLAIIGESARWGDHQRADQPYDRDRDWLSEQNRLFKEYFPERSDIVVQLYRQEGLFPSIDAPNFNQHGGIVSSPFEVAISAGDGTIYYTTDGTDPRLPGGAVSNTSLTYSTPIRVTEDTTFMARVLKDGEWSALNEATFNVQSPLSLRISEININPHPANLVTGLHELNVDNDLFEFIELTNVGNDSIDLHGVQLVETSVEFESEGVEFIFAPQILGPGEQIVVVRDIAAFTSRYGDDVRVASGIGMGRAQHEFRGSLADDGEHITLLDSQGVVIQNFEYPISRTAINRSSGHGSTIEPIDLVGDYGDSTNWRESSEFGGSPGSIGAGFDGRIILNEIGITSDDADGWLELKNASSQDIDISNWYVSSTPNDLFESRIASDISIEAGGFHTVPWEQLGFDLDSARGGELLLVETDDSGIPLRFVDYVMYPTTVAGITVGRSPTDANQMVALSHATRGYTNATPLVGDVIVSEVHFHSPDLDGEGTGQQAEVFEYIELFNRSEIDVDLGGWKISGDVDYLFRNGPILPAGQTLVVVSFRPNRNTQANPFRDAFGIDKSVKLVGPYIGRLSNQRGSVRLEKPLAPPTEESYFTPFVWVDAVDFTSRSPWPESTGGIGDSLTRHQASFGNLASSWTGNSPTPGATDLPTRWRGDANEDGIVNSSDLIQAMMAAKFEKGIAATFAEGDWNGDGFFDSEDLLEVLATGRYEV